MNLRVYLRLLHPVHAVVWTATQSLIWGDLLIFPFSGEDSNRWRIGLITLPPLIMGACVASAAHTAMHRPFFPLLPNGIRRLRRATFLTLAFAAPLIAASAAYFQQAPFLAELGYAAALLALPLTNQRSDPQSYRPGWKFLVVAGYTVVAGFGRAKLATAMETAPWAFLVGGVAVAAWCFRQGFSPQHVRARAEKPYNPLAANFYIFSNLSASRRYAQELLQHRARLTPEKITKTHSWPVRLVGPDTRSWLRVFRHATFGRNRGGFLKNQLLVTLIAVFYVAVLPLLGLLFTPGKSATNPSQYWQFLANLSVQSDPAMGSKFPSPILSTLGSARS